MTREKKKEGSGKLCARRSWRVTAFQWVQIPRRQSLVSSPLLKPFRIDVAVKQRMKPAAWRQINT